MQDNQPVEKSAPHSGAKKHKRSPRYSFEFKLKAVRLHLQEGFSQDLVCKEMGMGSSSLAVWVRAYRERGEEGLRPLPPPGGGGGRGRSRLPAPVSEKIVELKRLNPWWGIKRIAQVLRRMFLLQASPETVRVRLHEAGLMNEPPPKARRNLTRPRFFERATPNQMWQSDIFTFRLGGRYAYLIAFLDDYSRFVVGADLFRSPTAQAVIEVYRVAAAEYQPPKEMLTDNGRQYAAWRGTSRFEAEMKKDRVIHIKSRPQHPMTLGKVERFWATIWQDFLVRAQFESFEAARERIKLWIKYYNHRKPHQGIGGLCPADRYFEIQSELRKTIEAGIQENLLEMALRGQPRAPFYMVGRMEGQSVVLRAEKGKLKLSLNDDHNQTNELEYDLTKASQPAETNTARRNESAPQNAPQTDAGTELHRPAEGAGGPGGLDREGASGGDLPAALGQLDHLQPMAGAGDGGDAASPREPGEPGQRRGVESALAAVADQAPACGGDRPAGEPAGETPARQDPARGNEPEPLRASPDENPERSPGTGQRDPASPRGPDHGEAGRADVRHLAQDLLPVGEAGTRGDDRTTDPAAAGPPAQGGQPGAGSDEDQDRAARDATGDRRADGGSPRDPHGHAAAGEEARP